MVLLQKGSVVSSSWRQRKSADQSRLANGQVLGRDMRPLFELLQAYGSTNIVADLEKAVSRWNYYATLALAGLPDGAGIPTLIKLSQDLAVSSLENGDFALRPLTQAALQALQNALTSVTARLPK